MRWASDHSPRCEEEEISPDNERQDSAGRVALVTGGSKGIGRSCVQHLASDGAKVGFTCRKDDESVRSLLDWAQDAGLDAFKILSDASDTAAYDSLLKAVGERTRGKLDILINNVGDPIRRSSFANSDPQLWEQCLNLNLLSAVRTTLTFLPMLRKSSAAAIINISSMAGTTTGAGDSLHYGVSKAALETFTVGRARSRNHRLLQETNLTSPAHRVFHRRATAVCPLHWGQHYWLGDRGGSCSPALVASKTGSASRSGGRGIGAHFHRTRSSDK